MNTIWGSSLNPTWSQNSKVCLLTSPIPTAKWVNHTEHSVSCLQSSVYCFWHNWTPYSQDGLVSKHTKLDSHQCLLMVIVGKMFVYLFSSAYLFGFCYFLNPKSNLKKIIILTIPVVRTRASSVRMHQKYVVLSWHFMTFILSWSMLFPFHLTPSVCAQHFSVLNPSGTISKNI